MFVHQTHAGAEAELPWLLRRMRASVLARVDGEHVFWTDPELEALVEGAYPGLAPAFRAARVGVQRSDLGRLLVLHRFGGLYLDADVEVLRAPGAPLVGGPRLAVAPEPDAQVAALYGPSAVGEYLCNAVMYAPAGDAFLGRCLDEVKARWDALGEGMWTEFDALGGKLLTAMRRRHPELVDVVPAATCFPVNDLKLRFLPTHAEDARRVRTGDFGPDAQAVHYWVHSNFEGGASLRTFAGGEDEPVHAAAWRFFRGLYEL